MEHKESLKIIEEMIESAKSNIKDDGNIWIMWGWLVIAASTYQYIAMKLEYFKIAPLGWMLMPLGAVITIVYSIRNRNKQKVKTHVDDFMKALWTAFGIGIAIVIGFTVQYSYDLIMPLCLVLYGIGAFASGGALKFRPLKVGGLLCFLCALIAFNVSPENQLLTISAGVLVSYLIPGYILKSKYKQNVQKA